ncbi:MAG: hypothetical protein JXA33_03080 [Anaerolineae bacterium]|nr:hypothetical protein [Anaerolineae bacterium]
MIDDTGGSLAEEAIGMFDHNKRIQVLLLRLVGIVMLVIPLCFVLRAPGQAQNRLSDTITSTPSSQTGKTIKFRRLTLEDGLSQSTIYCILQDSQGFMWFGTGDGLNRYDGYHFKVYKHEADNSYSLTRNALWRCHRDQRDVLWFVTEDTVLHRYDPLTDRFYHYPIETDDPFNQSITSIRVLYGDSAGQLWIGTYGGGVAKYEPETDQLIYYHDLNAPESAGVHGNKVYMIYEDRAGVIWLGTGGGLLRYRPESDDFARYPYHIRGETTPHDPAKSTSQFITNIYEDREGRLWLGTTFGGLNQFDRETEQFIAYPHTPDVPQNLSGNTVRAIKEDRFGKLWIISMELSADGFFVSSGMERLDPETGLITPYRHYQEDTCSLSHNTVTNIFQDSQGNLWFHTVVGGVDVLDWDTGCFVHYAHHTDIEYTLSGDAIAAFYVDEAGGIWVGTEFNGLNFYDPGWNKFPYHQVTAESPYRANNNSILTMRATVDGIDNRGHAYRLWATTWAGVNLWDRRTNTFTLYRVDDDPSNAIMTLYEDPAGILWVGAQEGLYKAELPAEGLESPPLSITFTKVLTATGLGGSITGILPASDGTLWLGMRNIGLVRFDPQTARITYYSHEPEKTDSLSNNLLGNMFTGRDGAIWISTLGGLDKFDPETETFTHYRPDSSNPHSVSSASIFALYEDENSVTWLGTDNDGLQYLDPATNRFGNYREEDGLPNNVVYGILPDRNANLWLSTNKGLAKFDPQTQTVHKYTVQDGLQSNEFNYYAYYMAPDGEMFFGGVNGINAFYPELIKESTYIPPIVITDFLLTHKSVSPGPNSVLKTPIEMTDALELSYTDRVISFEFAALHYAAPDHNQYAYKMEGFDEDWNYVGNRRFATYTNLPPGRRYIFRVKGSNSDGVWNEEGTSLQIFIKPPYWQAIGFRVGFSMMGIASVAGILVWQMRKSRHAKNAFRATLHRELEAILGASYKLRAVLPHIPEIPGGCDTDVRLESQESLDIILRSGERIAELTDNTKEF